MLFNLICQIFWATFKINNCAFFVLQKFNQMPPSLESGVLTTLSTIRGDK